jgi:hypothetical protein
MNPIEYVLLQAEALAPAARLDYLRNQWSPAFDAAIKIDTSRPFNANTYSAQLVTAFLVAACITKLQNLLAPVSAFARKFSPDLMKPRATAELKFVTVASDSAGSATGKNLTAFEDGDTTISAVEIAVDQYTRPFGISNLELQSGLTLENLVEINTGKFSDILSGVVLAPLTTANFTATPSPPRPARLT